MPEGELLGELIPCLARARVFDGDTLLIDTHRAFVTAAPEFQGNFLVPRFKIDDFVERVSPYILGERCGPAGPLVILDHERLNIVLRDTLPGWAQGEGNPCRFPRWGDVRDLLWMMDAQQVESGVFETPSYPEFGRNVIEAGQLAGAQIVAASRAGADKRVISIHTILSRPAGFDQELRFRPLFLRLGRTMATATVEAQQDGKAVAHSLILMDKGAKGVIESQVAMPDVPGPDECPDYDYGMSGRYSRFVDDAYRRDPDQVGPAEIHSWVRYREQPAEPCLKQALLAQYTGHITIAAAMRPHRGISELLAHQSLSTGILALTIAFHDEPDLTEWMLYTNPVIYAGHGLAQGQGTIFSRGGRMLASYSVQAMIRAFDREKSGQGRRNALM